MSSRPMSTEKVCFQSIILRSVRDEILTHISGINFPSYAFENQAETEGFAKMARRAGKQVFGLPNYVVWHRDTDEKPGNA